jgi:predicted cupin superfamily sugar epimerase
VFYYLLLTDQISCRFHNIDKKTQTIHCSAGEVCQMHRTPLFNAGGAEYYRQQELILSLKAEGWINCMPPPIQPEYIKKKK